jgi:hypothetical protein
MGPPRFWNHTPSRYIDSIQSSYAASRWWHLFLETIPSGSDLILSVVTIEMRQFWSQFNDCISAVTLDHWGSNIGLRSQFFTFRHWDTSISISVCTCYLSVNCVCLAKYLRHPTAFCHSLTLRWSIPRLSWRHHLGGNLRFLSWYLGTPTAFSHFLPLRPGWPPTNLGLHVWIVWLCLTS